MGDKRIFRIGQVVKVNLNHRVLVQYDEKDYRRVKRRIDWGIKTDTNEPVLAIVTGVKTFQEGQYNKGSGGHSGYGGMDYDYDPPYVTYDRQVTTWAVRLGYKNKEIYFFEDDLDSKEVHFFFSQYVAFPNENIPYFYSSWNDHYRKKMSRESKDWPRDSKGRWGTYQGKYR
jgi:hypothetical protein